MEAFICFCRIRPSSFYREALLDRHLSIKKNIHTVAVFTIRKFTKMGETFRYHKVVKLGYRDRPLTETKSFRLEEIMVRKETYLLGSKPNMFA
jgi:hypothetical protein